MNAVWIVLQKEVIDNLRDRRTVIGTLLLGALLGPVVIAGDRAHVQRRHQ
jgi:ABC-type Na+ efflux pump permease subunit